jgi:putative lipoprotein
MISRPARIHLAPLFSLFALVGAQILPAQIVTRMGMPSLSGSSWQLVGFQGSDRSAVYPDVRSKYTLAFGRDGRVNARIDCNSGSATWASSGSGQLTLGPLALTRVLCPRGSLHDMIVRNWPQVRSYTFRNGHLILSLADGSTYEFEQTNGEATTSGPVQGGASNSLRGTATYRERMALPRNAIFEASLEDVSRSGTQSDIIARVRNEQPGNIPIPFLIAYDPSRIIQNRSYIVRARILVDGNIWFMTDQNYPVLTGGRGNDVQLVLRRASGSGGAIPPRVGPSTAALENTYWRLVDVGGASVTADARHPEANLILHPDNRTVAGSGGCNRFSGSYQLNGDRLTFSRVASTMMACVSGMETEKGFLNVLGRARRWRISGQTLDLLDNAGSPLARFEAVYM